MTIRTGTSDIEALLELIQSAAYSAVEEYRKTGHGVPSPDDASLHPLDSAPDALALKMAIRVLEGACERLCTTLAQPMHTIANVSPSSSLDPSFLSRSVLNTIFSSAVCLTKPRA